MGNLSRQQLMRAKNLFLSGAETVQALFVDNNLIVNELYSDADSSEDAANMSEYVAQFHPYIRRSTTFHSNAGIANLIAGRGSESIQYFDRAISGSGPPVNKLTSEVNRLIALYVEGAELNVDDAYRILRKRKRSNIPAEFDYHQTMILANLWKLFQDKKDVCDEIRVTLKKESFLPYNHVMEEPSQLLDFTISNIRSVSRIADNAKVPGRLGTFYDRHGLFLSAHVFYR